MIRRYGPGLQPIGTQELKKKCSREKLITMTNDKFKALILQHLCVYLLLFHKS